MFQELRILRKSGCLNDYLCCEVGSPQPLQSETHLAKAAPANFAPNWKAGEKVGKHLQKGRQNSPNRAIRNRWFEKWKILPSSFWASSHKSESQSCGGPWHSYQLREEVERGPGSGSRDPKLQEDPDVKQPQGKRLQVQGAREHQKPVIQIKVERPCQNAKFKPKAALPRRPLHQCSKVWGRYLKAEAFRWKKNFYQHRPLELEV